MSKALPALMIALGLLLLIATLYDVALRMNPALTPTLPPTNSPRVKVLTETKTVTVTENVTVMETIVKPTPLNVSSSNQRYLLPSGAIMLDLSNVPANTPVKSVARMNYSEGILRNVIITVVGWIKPEAWNSTVMVYVSVTFNPPLPNGTEVDVTPVWVASAWWPILFSVSQYHLPMQGSVSRLNMTLCYHQQHLPSLTLLAVKLTYLNNLSASDSFMLLLKVGRLTTSAHCWRALIGLNGNLTPLPPALLPLKEGGVLIASTVEVGGDYRVIVIKLSPKGKVLNAVSMSVTNHSLNSIGYVKLMSLTNDYLLALGSLATHRVTLVRLNDSLSVIKAVTLTLPSDMSSWSVATLGDRVYVALTRYNAPPVALIVLDGNLTPVKAWAYSIDFPPNNLMPAEIWCSISKADDDLILACMPSPSLLSVLKSQETPVLIAQIDSDGSLKNFRFLLYQGIGAATPSIAKLGNEYLFVAPVGITSNIRPETLGLLITLGSNLRLRQAKLVNMTFTSRSHIELSKLGKDRIVLMGVVRSRPYLLILDKNGSIISSVPQKPGYLFSFTAENDTIYLTAQKAEVLNNTELTVIKLPVSKISATTVTPVTLLTQVTQPTTSNYVSSEPLLPTILIRVEDMTNYLIVQSLQPQITVIPMDP